MPAPRASPLFSCGTRPEREPRDIRFVLHRPKRSENIGAAARALANAGAFWLVAPRAWDGEV